jgi:hypothetical protein
MDPVPFIEPTITLTERVISMLLRREVTLFAYGAEGAGKTAFRERIRSGGLSKVSDLFIGSTMGWNTVDLKAKVSQKDKVRPIRIQYIDAGGDKIAYRSRRNAMRQALPLGMLLFLDHNSPVTKGADQQQIDDGCMDPSRVQRHHEVFGELRGLLYDEPKVREACRALIVVVTKNDLWKNCCRIDDFATEFREDVHRLLEPVPEMTIPEFMACSAYTGDGISQILQTLFDKAGKTSLLGIRLPD